MSELQEQVEAMQDRAALIMVKYERIESRLLELESAMKEINDIRNDIVGRQWVSISAHVYPLVAILNRCGFEGMSYDGAKAAIGGPA